MSNSFLISANQHKSSTEAKEFVMAIDIFIKERTAEVKSGFKGSAAW